MEQIERIGKAVDSSFLVPNREQEEEVNYLALARILEEQTDPKVIEEMIRRFINNGSYLRIFPHLTRSDIIKHIPPQYRVFDRQRMQQARNNRCKPRYAVTSARNTNWLNVLKSGTPRQTLNTSKSPVFSRKIDARIWEDRPGGLGMLVANIDTNTIGLHFEGREGILGPSVSRLCLHKKNGKLHFQYMLDIPENMWEGYNQVVVDFLWNLLHSLENLSIEKIQKIPDLKRAWDYFKYIIQEVIAYQVLAQKESGEIFDLVIQDTYNQVFLADKLKAEGFNQPIHTMHHIPFPSVEDLNSIISKLPEHLQTQIKLILNEFFTAFSKYDSIMLQTTADKKKFLELLANFTNLSQEELGEVRKKIFINPATVDIKKIQEKVQNPAFMKFSESLVNKLEECFKEAGGTEGLFNSLKNNSIENVFVDFGTRVDPIKKIPEKIESFGRMLDSHPDLIGKTVFVQQISPSRMDNPTYQRELEKILEAAREINRKYPGSVIIIYESISHDEVLALNVLFNKLGINVTNVTGGIEGMSLSAQESSAVSLAISKKPQIPTIISNTAGWGHSLEEAGYPYVVGRDNMSKIMYLSIGASDEERQQSSNIVERWLREHSWQETQEAVIKLFKNRQKMKQFGNVLINDGCVPATGNFRLNENGAVEILVSDFDGTMVDEGGSESDKLKQLADISSRGYRDLERYSLNPVICSQKTLPQLIEISNVLGQENRFLIAEGGGVIYLGKINDFQKRILQAMGLYLLQIKDDEVLSRNPNLNPEDYIIKLSPIDTNFLSSQLSDHGIVNSLNNLPEDFLSVCSNYTNRDEAEKGTSLSNSVVCNFPPNITPEELNQKRKTLEEIVKRYNLMHKDNPIALRNYNEAGSEDPISSILYPANNEKPDAIKTVKEIIEMFTGKNVIPSFAGNNHNDSAAFEYVEENGGSAYLNPTVGLPDVPPHVIVLRVGGAGGFNEMVNLHTSRFR